LLGGAVFNENGADVDFRVEGDTNANLLFVDASADKVGIGTASPTNLLHLESASSPGIKILDTTNNVNLLLYSQDTNSHIGTYSNHSLIFDTNSSEKLRIDSSGNVGIGTSSPSYKLHVTRTDAAGDYAYLGASSDGGQRGLVFTSSDSGIFLGAIHTINAGSGQGQIAFATGSTERLRIDSSGNVGIGTTSPGQALEVAGNIGINANLIHNGDTDTMLSFSAANQVDIQCASTLITRFTTNGLATGNGKRIDYLSSNGERSGVISNTDSGANALVISADPDNSRSGTFMNFAIDGTERMRLDSSGRLLIGTTTEGTVDSDDLTIATSGNTGMTIRSGTTSNGAIHFSDATSGAAEYAGYIDYDHNVDKFDMGSNGSRFLSADSNSVVTLGKANFGGSSGVIAYGNTGGVRKDALLALNASATVAGRGAGVSVGGTTSALGSFYCNKAGNADSDGGNVFLESVGALRLLTGGANDRMIITSGGNVVLNSTTTRVYNGHTPKLSIQGNNFSESTLAITSNSTGNDGAYLFFAKQRSGSAGGSTVVANGDLVGQLRYLAGDGTDVESEVANITVSIDGAPGSNDTPGRITFATTNDGGNAATERMRITQAGQILMGSTSNNGINAKLAVSADGVPGYYANPAGLSVNTTNSNDAHCVEFFQGRFNKRVLTQSHSNTGGVTFEVFEQADVNVGIITGNGSTTNFNTNPSDRSLKKNFESWDENVLSLFKNINPQKFNYIQQNDGEEKSKGFIAQEMVDSFPEAYPLIESEDNKHYFNPSGMVVYLMKAIQELEAEVAALKSA
jgi:hypothetical protein